MYKLINDLVNIPSNYFISPHPPLRRGYYKQLFTGIDSYKFSFIPFVIKLWNSLPFTYVINSPTLDQFCSNLKRYNHFWFLQTIT